MKDKQIYVWLSEDLKKAIDTVIDEDLLKKYFVKQYGKKSAETMEKLGVYAFPGEHGLILAVPDSRTQKEHIKYFGDLETLQKEFLTYTYEMSKKYLGVEKPELSFSDLAVYDGGIEKLTAEISFALSEHRSIDKYVFEETIKPYLALSSLISIMEKDL